MAWRKLEDTFYDSPKIRRLARHLEVGRAQAAGHIALLWSWALRHAPDGDLSKYDDEDIEDAVHWRGNRGAFVTACTATSFIDESSAQRLVIHNWIERGGSYVENQRKQRLRAKKKDGPELSGTVPGLSRDSDRTVRKCPALEEKRREKNRSEDLCIKSNPSTDQTLPISTGADAPALSANRDGQGKLRDDPKAARDIQEVWQYYRAHHPGTAKILRSNRKEYGLIRARLQDFDADTIKAAIDGYHRSPFHTGDNDRGKSYLSLTLILRDISHVQAGLEMTAKRIDTGPKSRMLDPAAFAGDTDQRKGEQWKIKPTK